MLMFDEHINSINITKENLDNKYWRIQNLYPIRNKKGQLVPFKLNIHQKKVNKQLIENIVNKDYSPLVVLKARQVGISTFFCIWFLDDVLFYEGRRAVIQSQKQETMRDIFDICRTALNFMPNIKGIIEKEKSDINHKEGKISIPNSGSFIESKLEVRSTAVNMIHFSEYAFTDLKRITASVGSLSPECIKVYESTPYGLNHFYDFYKEQKNKNPKNVFFIPWFDHPEYEVKDISPITDYTKEELRLKNEYNVSDNKLEFRRRKIQEMKFLDSEHLTFNQEYPENDEECFLLSGSALVDPMILRDLKNKCDNTTPIKRFWDGKLLIKLYEIPELKVNQQKKFYGMYMGVDPAEGIGQDYSAVVLIGVDDQMQSSVLMTMRGFENPIELDKKIRFYIDKYFKFRVNGMDIKPYLVVERNNHGHALLALLEPHYFNLYVHDKDRRLGFLTTKVSKRMILGNLFNLLNSDSIVLNDPIIASELRTLIKKDTGQIEAEEGKKDDMIMALSLAFQGYFSLNRNYPHFEYEEKKTEDKQIDNFTNASDYDNFDIVEL